MVEFVGFHDPQSAEDSSECEEDEGVGDGDAEEAVAEGGVGESLVAEVVVLHSCEGHLLIC